MYIWHKCRPTVYCIGLQLSISREWGVVLSCIGGTVDGRVDPLRFCWNDASGLNSTQRRHDRSHRVAQKREELYNHHSDLSRVRVCPLSLSTLHTIMLTTTLTVTELQKAITSESVLPSGECSWQNFITTALQFQHQVVPSYIDRRILISYAANAGSKKSGWCN